MKTLVVIAATAIAALVAIGQWGIHERTPAQICMRETGGRAGYGECVRRLSAGGSVAAKASTPGMSRARDPRCEGLSSQDCSALTYESNPDPWLWLENNRRTDPALRAVYDGHGQYMGSDRNAQTKASCARDRDRFDSAIAAGNTATAAAIASDMAHWCR